MTLGERGKSGSTHLELVGLELVFVAVSEAIVREFIVGKHVEERAGGFRGGRDES